jgi:D-alanyl-D-alanine carboxypeptidase
MRIGALLMVGVFVASACSNASADGGDGADRDPALIDEPFTVVTANPVAESDTTTTAPPRSPSTPTSTPPTSATADEPAPTSSASEPSGEVADAAAETETEIGTASSTEGDDAGVVLEDDDPSFEIEPLQPLDLELARFPTDDAGLGGASTPDAPDAATPPTGWAAFDASLDAALIRPGNSAASVAVMIDGDIVHTAEFGSRVLFDFDPVEPQDRYRVASISKVITAVTLLQLVEDGEIGLDDPVGQRIADHLGVGPVGGSAQLTPRQLLTHRTGWGKYRGTFFGKGAVDCADAARAGLRSGAGGGGYTYSNMNYCVAAMLIEAVTDLDYEAAVYRHLLTPLGLSGPRIAPTIDPGPDEIEHVTTIGRNYMETLGGAGAWVASPSDIVTILDSLDLSTTGWKPLEPETISAMFTPGGGTAGQRGYGLGIISYGAGRYGHTGTIESTHAMTLLRGDGVTWALTVAGQYPGESTQIESIVNRAFEAGGFVG